MVRGCTLADSAELTGLGEVKTKRFGQLSYNPPDRFRKADMVLAQAFELVLSKPQETIKFDIDNKGRVSCEGRDAHRATDHAHGTELFQN
eukprot:7634517-Lingulodinium_polyedra.AAC.1